MLVVVQMKKDLRQLATNLRVEENKSYSEIRKILGVPKSTLSYWLKELPLEESKIKELQKAGWKKSEASRERYRNTMRLIKLAKDEKVYQKYLTRFNNLSKDVIFVAGLMLYLGEGSKKDYTKIVLTNTDPNVIFFFIKWAIEYLGVRKADYRVQLHLYEDMTLEKEINLWQNKLKIPKKQFYKSSIRKLREGSFTYKDSIRHGTCSIYLMGVDRKRELSMAIKAFVDKYIKMGA